MLLLAGCGGSNGDSGALGASSEATRRRDYPCRCAGCGGRHRTGRDEARVDELEQVVDHRRRLPAHAAGRIRADHQRGAAAEGFQARSSAVKDAANAVISEISQSLVNTGVKMVAMNPNIGDLISLVVRDAGGLTSADLPLLRPELKSLVLRKPGATLVEVSDVTVR